MKKLLPALLTLFCIQKASADSTSFFNARFWTWTANTGIATGVQVLLHQAWYRDYQSTAFHWTNDNENWLQMDKAGHAFSAAFLTSVSTASFRYAGYNRKKSAVFGTSIALAFQGAIEYSDGHSTGWGASWGDLTANLAGGLFAGIQQYAWGDIRLPFSVTFQRSEFARLRPNVLGKNLPQRMLKDYNAQTYWISFIPSRLGLNSTWWPKWLGIAAGYGIDGCIGAVTNIWQNSAGQWFDYTSVKRQRQFAISPDFSFGHIKTRSKALHFLLRLTDYWKLPAPALVLNSNAKPVFYWISW